MFFQMIKKIKAGYFFEVILSAGATAATLAVVLLADEVGEAAIKVYFKSSTFLF